MSQKCPKTAPDWNLLGINESTRIEDEWAREEEYNLCPEGHVQVLIQGTENTHQSHGAPGLGSWPWQRFSWKAWATRASVGSALLPVLAAQLPGAPLLVCTSTPNQPSQSNKEKRKASQLEHNETRQAKLKSKNSAFLSYTDWSNWIYIMPCHLRHIVLHYIYSISNTGKLKLASIS